MKKLWIWIISIVLLVAIAVTIFVTIYLPKWRQAQYLEKIEHYYELQGNEQIGGRKPSPVFKGNS